MPVVTSRHRQPQPGAGATNRILQPIDAEPRDILGTVPIRNLVSLRRCSMRRLPRHVAAIAAIVRVAGAGLVIWTGAIHLHLWLEGYRYIPTNGPLFLVDALAAFLLAVALIVWPRPVIGLLAAGFLISTLGALVISINVGLFGFRESLSASFVGLSLIIESIAALGLLIWTVLVVARR
jgi:hypothetical protein